MMNSEMIEWMICSSPPLSPADGTEEGEQSSYSGVGEWKMTGGRGKSLAGK